MFKWIQRQQNRINWIVIIRNVCIEQSYMYAATNELCKFILMLIKRNIFDKMNLGQIELNLFSIVRWLGLIHEIDNESKIHFENRMRSLTERRESSKCWQEVKFAQMEPGHVQCDVWDMMCEFWIRAIVYHWMVSKSDPPCSSLLSVASKTNNFYFVLRSEQLTVKWDTNEMIHLPQALTLICSL